MGTPLLSLGAPTPLIDGITPVFVESGVSPLVSPGIDLPPGSVIKAGADYFQKVGPGLLDWQALGASVGLSVGANPKAFRTENARYFWGQPTGDVAPSISTTGASVDGQFDRLRAYPEQFPADITLTVLQQWWNCQNAGTGMLFRVGLYSDTGEGYPGALIYDSGDLNLEMDDAQTLFTLNPNVDIDGGSNIWYAWMFNAACDGKHPTLSAYVYQMDGNNFPAMQGWPVTAAVAGKAAAAANDSLNSAMLYSAGLACMGWGAPQAYGAMPATFPAIGGAQKLFLNNTSDGLWRRWRPAVHYQFTYR